MKRILIQCSSEVNRKAVTRKTINGVEHIVISSHTLPDDIVMNGGLYPAEEIAKSFETLEGTLAPIEHPIDPEGNFISAVDGFAINNFYAGVVNENVSRDNGRVSLDKVVNVPEALKTDRGKRLLDRINELETNDNPRPMHTSTGVFLDVEELKTPQTNSKGDKFTWIARNMVFNHDAILLDSIAAAQPHQGVGMAVNRDGDKIQVEQFTIKANDDNSHREALSKALLSNQRNEAARKLIIECLDKIQNNESLVTIDADVGDGLSHDEIRRLLDDAIAKPPLGGDWVVEIFEDVVIFTAGDVLFSAPYIIDGKIAKIVGIPLPVVRDVNFIPKTNGKEDVMKELMLKTLAEAGVTVNAEISEEDLLAKYNELVASKSSKDEGGENIGDVVTNAVTESLKPVTEKLDSLERKINEQGVKEHAEHAEIVGNSDKYAGLDAEVAKKIDPETLKGMAANCGAAYGVPLTNGASDGQGDNEAYEMPK